jgi:hypothetical protein
VCINDTLQVDLAHPLDGTYEVGVLTEQETSMRRLDVLLGISQLAAIATQQA